MIPNLRPGDHALVIGTHTFINNIGRSVECVELVDPSDLRFHHICLPLESYHDLHWVVLGDLIVLTDGGPTNVGAALVPEKHLMPLTNRLVLRDERFL